MIFSVLHLAGVADPKRLDGGEDGAHVDGADDVEAGLPAAQADRSQQVAIFGVEGEIVFDLALPLAVPVGVKGASAPVEAHGRRGIKGRPYMEDLSRRKARRRGQGLLSIRRPDYTTGRVERNEAKA